MTTAQIQEEALTRAITGQSFANYAAIIAGFAERGIPADEVRPRENVFTYDAWRALGRQVRKGEKAVKVCTWKPVPAKVDKATGETLKPARKIPWTAFVFHVSQTDPIGGGK